MESLKLYLEGLLNKSNKTKVKSIVDATKSGIEHVLRDKLRDDAELAEIIEMMEKAYNHIGEDEMDIDDLRAFVTLKPKSILGPSIGFYLVWTKDAPKGTIYYQARWYWRTTGMGAGVNVLGSNEARGKIGSFHDVHKITDNDADFYEVPLKDMKEYMQTIIDINPLGSWLNKPTVNAFKRILQQI